MNTVPELLVRPIAGLPMFVAGMSIAQEICTLLAATSEGLRNGDICVVAQKIVSKTEGRALELSSVEARSEAVAMSAATGRKPALLQAILDESNEILRATPSAVIARHRSGHVLANAGIDVSNVEGGNAGRVLRWPIAPDSSARAIRRELRAITGASVAVVIADSMGRAWRIGTVGTAIGCAGLTVIDDRRGRDIDLYGRSLQATVIAVADAIAAMASLVMGEGNEGTPAVIVRGGERWILDEDGPGAASGLRPIEEDMFR